MPDKQIGRLAMRHEGMWWVAYYALTGTMDGAVELGRIAMRFVDIHPERRDGFIAFMRDAVADIIEEKIGQRPVWPNAPQSAPESERAGHS